MITQPARRFTRIFLLSSMGLCLLVGAFNAVMDPYGNLGLNWAGVFIGAEREYKPVLIREYSGDAVILGNSQVGAIDPDLVQSPFRFFNASLSGASAEEIRCFAERHIHEARLVVLGLDFGMFRNDPGKDLAHPLPDSVLEQGLGQIFNLRTAEYSFITLRRHLARELPGWKANGFTYNQTVARVALDRKMSGPAYGPQPEEVRRHFEKFVYDPRRLEEVRRLKEILVQRKIPLLVYFTPRHEEITTLLEASPAYSGYQQWRSDMRQLFPGALDFSGPEYAGPGYYYKFDMGHLTPDASLEVLQKVLQDDLNRSGSPEPKL